VSVESREYQTRAIAEARACIARGSKRVLLVAPTGAGKTTIGGLIVKGRIQRSPVARVAWVAHRRELITQAADRLRLFGLEVGALGEGRAARVQVASAQALLSSRELPDADLVVFDEAHHYVSEEWIAIPRAYAKAGAISIGLTATPERDDGKGLGGDEGIFDDLVVVAQIGDLTREGHLVPCRILAPLERVRKLALEPVDAYERYAMGRSAVVFAPHVKAARDFADAFRARGIEAGVVHGELALSDRDGTLARFASGDLRVVCNVNVLTEGWDAPIADVCILARKIGSVSLYLQCVGRVLRTRPGKGEALLLDLAGNVSLHGKPDEERVYSLDGEAVTRKGASAGEIRFCRSCSEIIPDGLIVCPDCGTEGRALVTPKAEGVDLDPYAWAKRLPPDKRIDRLARDYATGIVRGYQRGWADARYRRFLGHHPPNDVKVEAWRKAQEIAARDAAKLRKPEPKRGLGEV
jgi:DNA repair protein RadD